MKKLRGERKQDALVDGAYRFCGVAAAMVGGALIGGYASMSAADSQAESADRAANMSMDQYRQTREDQAPWREAGAGTLAQMVSGLQAGGEFNRNFTMADYQADPGMAFRVQQGEQGINRAATARGSRYSGATLKALARFNSDLGSQEYGKAYDRFNNDTTTRFNRLASVSGLGQTATAQTTAAGQSAAATAGSAIQNAGTARASGYVGAANSINSGIGQMTNNYQLSQMLGKSGGADPYASYQAPAGSVDNFVF